MRPDYGYISQDSSNTRRSEAAAMRPDYGYISQDSSNTRRSEAAAMRARLWIYT